MSSRQSPRPPAASPAAASASEPLRVLIVDDEAPARRITAKLLTRYCDDVASVAVAADIPEAVAALRLHRPDLVLLDIELREATGFELVGHIDAATTQIVFVTAYTDYAVDAFRVEATDYLVKPLEIEQLRETMARVRERRDRSRGLPPGKKLILPGAEGRRMIAHEHIILLEADGSYTTVVTRDGAQLVVRKLGQLEDDLAGGGFFRCHRSYVVNVRHVRELRTGSVIMSDGGEVPVSRARRAEINEVLKALA